jgi:hypothetical protein
METRAIVGMYEGRGFNVTRLEADQEFKCITNGDHVHEVERSIMDHQGAHTVHGTGTSFP